MSQVTDFSSQPSRSLLPSTWECPPLFRSRLGEQAGSQRLMQADKHLLLVLHAPPEADQAERVGRFFWRAADGTWASSHHGGGANALMKLLNEYDQIIEQYDVKEHAASSARDYFDLLTAATPLHRSIANLQLVVQERERLARRTAT